MNDHGLRKTLDGVYSAAVVVKLIPANAVSRCLPEGFRLSEPLLAAGDMYPVMFSFGLQDDVFGHVRGWPRDTSAWRIPLCLLKDYAETVIAIPELEMEGDESEPPQRFLYFLKLYLDEWFPTFGGRVCYGLNKERARITWTDGEPESRCQVASRAGGSEIISARWSSSGTGEGLDRSKLNAWMGRTLVSERRLSSNFERLFQVVACTDAAFTSSVARAERMCSRYTWELTGASRLHPIDIDVQLGDSAPVELGIREFSVAGGQGGPEDAFFYSKRWTLNYPHRCCDGTR